MVFTIIIKQKTSLITFTDRIMLVNFYKSIAMTLAVAYSVSAIRLEADEESALASSYLDDYSHGLAEIYNEADPA